MNQTPRIKMPFLIPGQAQKEISHNEALQVLDMLVMPSAIDGPRNAPPVAPGVGDAFLVGSSPTGVFSDHPSSLAQYTEGGWRFSGPWEGMHLYLRSAGCFATFAGGSWVVGKVTGTGFSVNGVQVVSSREGAISDPSGGSLVDSEARTAVTAILVALRHHGLIEP